MGICPLDGDVAMDVGSPEGPMSEEESLSEEGEAPNVVDLEEARKKKALKLKKGWARGILRDYTGTPKPTMGNVVLILQNKEEWEGVFSYDAFAARVRKCRPLPASATEIPNASIDSAPWLEDEDVDLTTIWMERNFQFSPATQIVRRAIIAVARANASNPILNYLEELRWDKTLRLDRWLVDHAMVEDSPYVRAVGSKWMISAIARAVEPASKVDHVLILEGDQRGGKSAILEALCPNVEWFLSTAIDISTKDVYQILQGKWLVEFAEFESMTKSGHSKVKAFITDKRDTYRRAYAMEPVDQKRRCVFAASVNPEGSGEYLKDPTGGGRWWPVWSASNINARLDPKKLIGMRDQLWAEAYVRYRAGEAWHLVEPELIRAAQEEQDSRRQAHPWESAISDYLSRERVYEEGTTIRDLLERVCGLEMASVERRHSMEVANILVALGWVLRRRKKLGTGEQVKVYEPGPRARKPTRKPK